MSGPVATMRDRAAITRFVDGLNGRAGRGPAPAVAARAGNAEPAPGHRVVRGGQETVGVAAGDGLWSAVGWGMTSFPEADR